MRATNRFPALFRAILDDDPGLVATLIRREAAVGWRGPLGLTPIELAQALGRFACLRHLQAVPERRISVGRPGAPRIEQFSTEEFEQWSGVQYVPFTVVANYQILRIAIRACAKGHRTGFFDAERRWLSRWHAVELQTGQMAAGLAIKWVNAVVGYGLFAERAHPEKAYIGCYTGQLMRRSFYGRVTNDYRFRYPTGADSVVRPLLIDAKKMGNELRYANHSAEPNMEGIGIPYGPLVQVVFRTNRAVREGEQLTYDYGPDFWTYRKKNPLIF